MTSGSNGTSNVVLRSQLSGYEIEAEIPHAMKVKTLMTQATKELGLALFTQTLEDTLVALRHEKTGVRLQEHRTVGSYDLQDGDVLEIYEEPIAGSCPHPLR